MKEFSNCIVGVHEHDSFLEHQEEEKLKDLQKFEAWNDHKHGKKKALFEEIKKCYLQEQR